MNIYPLLVLLLSWRIQVGAELTLLPQSLTVLRGEEARFTCSPSNPGWTVMVWLLNGLSVLTISNSSGVLPAVNPNVSAVINSDSKSDSWTFILRNTGRHNQGTVTCELQGIGRKSARLFVQEKGSVKVSGHDKLAFKGDMVFFECQASGWSPKPTLEWQVDDKLVSQSEYNISSSEESGKSLFTVISTLSVTAAKSSNVSCLASVSALPEPLESSVRLTVVAEVAEVAVVVQEGGGCTVPLAIIASFTALLLLLLLCICAALWFRQRRQAKQSPQAALWFNQSGDRRDTVAETTRGKVNLGYSTEGPTDAAYNEQSMETGGQMAFVSFHKVPDVVSSRSLSLHSESQTQSSQPQESPRNVRRITTV